ncbi:MAG: DNA-binding protein [Rhodospirillales bacterium]|nr:DNA-binding protein [Rhodospirillales bacterium]
MDPAPAFILSVRPTEACRLIGIGKTTLYELVADKKIRLVKIGRASVIPLEDLRRLIAEGELA